MLPTHHSLPFRSHPGVGVILLFILAVLFLPASSATQTIPDSDHTAARLPVRVRTTSR